VAVETVGGARRQRQAQARRDPERDAKALRVERQDVVAEDRKVGLRRQAGDERALACAVGAR
jgi:hypothetical protein